MNLRIFSRYILVLLIFSLILIGSTSADQRYKKPQPPLQITIAPVLTSVTSETIRPGDVVDFVVTTRSSIDSDEMIITVSIPKGFKLAAGTLTWSGAAKKNEANMLNFSVKVADTQFSVINAKVVIPLSNSSSFSASTHYAIGVQSKKKIEPSQPVKKDRKGKDVIEYR